MLRTISYHRYLQMSSNTKAHSIFIIPFNWSMNSLLHRTSLIYLLIWSISIYLHINCLVPSGTLLSSPSSRCLPVWVLTPYAGLVPLLSFTLCACLLSPLGHWQLTSGCLPFFCYSSETPTLNAGLTTSFPAQPSTHLSSSGHLSHSA